MPTRREDLSIGPWDDPLVIDKFTYKQVKGKKCFATIAQKVCKTLLEGAKDTETEFLCICVPCYNENLEDLIKTIMSLMQNIEFMKKKAKIHDHSLRADSRKQFRNTVPVICPIFDGVKALSKDMKDWIVEKFSGLMDDIQNDFNSLEIEASIEGGLNCTEVKVGCSKWWYCADDKFAAQGSDQMRLLPTGDNSDISMCRLESEVRDFYMVPIVKRNNHRKYNSHEWFFNSVCRGLKETVTFVYLTDCGTTYDPTCLGKLMIELSIRPDLIGVTARMRVATPGPDFHPCENSPFSCLKGSHNNDQQNACWKCYATFFLSPCPCQGFEMESTFIVGSAMYNLVETLPVMPGPCQLLDWKKIKEFGVVEDYFYLLFNEQVQNHVLKLPSYRKFMTDRDRLGTKWIPGATVYYQPEIKWQTLLYQRRRWLNGAYGSYVFFFFSKRARSRVGVSTFDSHKIGRNARNITLLWSLQLLQLVLILVSPAVLGALSYLSLLDCIELSPKTFSWAVRRLPFNWADSSNFRVSEFALFLYLVIYCLWTLQSFFAVRGKMPELVCQFVALCSLCFVIPIYYSLSITIFARGLDMATGLIIGTIVLPSLLAFSTSFTSGFLYWMYLPWSLSMVFFTLVYIPSYSFARLWDTSWGNRSEVADIVITTDDLKAMKSRNLILIFCLILTNFLLTYAVIKLQVSVTNSVSNSQIFPGKCIFLILLLLFPSIIQIFFSSFFLLVVKPLRPFFEKAKVHRISSDM